MLSKKIYLLPHQKEFVKSNAMHTAIVGGYGSGKTEGGLYKLFSIMLSNGVDTGYYLPTYSLVEDVALKKIPAILDNMEVGFTMKKRPYNVTLKNGSTVMLRSMDNPQLIAGYEVGYSVIDEIDRMRANQSREAFESITARNRVPMPNHPNAVDFVCTPEGFRFLYDFFVRNPSENKKLIKAKTEDNPFLPPDYIERLKETYDNQKLQAYLYGEFVNLTSGSVFADYDTIEHDTDREVTQSNTLHIGMDFNITKMNAVVHIYENGVAYAVDEFVNYYDTRELCEAIKQRYKDFKINVYPDASGSSRNTAGESDFNIIRQFKFNILSLKKNSFVKDRINTANMAFRQGKYKVNRRKCPNYAEALTQLAYKNGEPDKSSDLDHITDAGTYYINYTFNNNRGRVFI